MTRKVLLVDDEANVLQGYQRVLRRRFDLSLAQGGAEALELLEAQGPFAAIVSDMRMPGMDGVTLLEKVKHRWPETTRVMLTGNADQATAMDAVNRGSIFRFLTKPCDSEQMGLALDAAIRQYELVTAEKQLLEQTLKGSLELLVELLSILDPVSFGRAQTMAELAEGVARNLAMPEPWVLGIASILSQIGILTIPAAVVDKLRGGGFLNSSEREIANRVPEVGFNLLKRVPRLEQVAEAIYYMNKNFNGTGFPADSRKGAEIPLGGRILRAVADYLPLLGSKGGSKPALAEMEFRTTWYDLEVLRALRQVVEEREPTETETRPADLAVKDLRLGYIVVEGIETATGLLLVPAGTRLGFSHLEKLRNFARLGEVREPIRALVPEIE
jgi:response regulator RpfG family c-di-GMP phosphodiesterase